VSLSPALFSSQETGDHHATPQDFFDTLDAEFNFTLDACASDRNRKASEWFGLDHPDRDRRDGLASPWETYGAVWCNPPYGRSIGAWMEKCSAEAAAGRTVVALVPARTDTRWFHDHVLAVGAEVRYVRGRLKFGGQANSAPFPSVVIVYRPEASA
jgi:phage N-6-adenine-methyltransferase